MLVNLTLFALLGLVLAMSGVGVMDKPLEFLFIMLLVVLIQHQGP